VVVLVDDLQFADAASLEFLIQMGQRLRTSRIQLVTAECDTAIGVSTTELSWRTGLLRERHFSRLRVRPLSPRITGEMLTELSSSCRWRSH